jgi:[ribosomal protein S5]-alanine N-acetyltransferase
MDRVRDAPITGGNMLPQPILQTSRLLLRPFTLADAPDVAHLAGAQEIASTTLNIPHPYELSMAEEWIGRRSAGLEQETHVGYALTLLESGELIGGIGMSPTLEHRRAELGYWIAVPYWGQGLCTEAAAEMLRFGFEDLDLHRIMARHIERNPASGRVMQKLGMTREGCMRHHILKWGQYEDVVFYGLLKEGWLARRPVPPEAA